MVRYVKITKSDRKIGWLVSIAIGLTILTTDVLLFWGKPPFDDYIAFAIMLTLLTPAVLSFLDSRWRSGVNDNIPVLLRDLTEAQRAGFPLVRAFEESAKGRYGPLTKELEKASYQLTWGMPFDEVVTKFGERVGTLLSKVSARLMIEASKAGARVHRIFESVTTFVQEMRNLELKRRAEIRPYVSIVYAAFFIFLFVTMILVRVFFAPSEILGFVSTEMISQSKTLLFRMAMAEAFFSGLIAGKMGEGAVSGGFKHSLIMMGLGYYLFITFVGAV